MSVSLFRHACCWVRARYSSSIFRELNIEKTCGILYSVIKMALVNEKPMELHPEFESVCPHSNRSSAYFFLILTKHRRSLCVNVNKTNAFRMIQRTLFRVGQASYDVADSQSAGGYMVSRFRISPLRTDRLFSLLYPYLWRKTPFNVHSWFTFFKVVMYSPATVQQPFPFPLHSLLQPSHKQVLLTTLACPDLVQLHIGQASSSSILLKHSRISSPGTYI